MDTPVTEARDLAVVEAKTCARPSLNPPHQNSVRISGGWVKTTQKQSHKDILQKEEHSKNNIARNEWLLFKHIKIGTDDAIIEVGFHKEGQQTTIGWTMELYCPTERISFSGPAIKNPDPSYFKKFKAGDIAMPEPEKTIFESIRCIEPKTK
jgi:hypothetical protein